MILPNRTLFCGNFPELQDKFITEITEQRKLDPLAPLWVVVNSHLVGLVLQRELAWSGCSHANLRFHTLAELAAERAVAELSRRGMRLLSSVTQDALMERAIGLCGELGYFHRICSRGGFRRAAWKTLDGLRSAGITLEVLAYAHARLTNPALQTLRKKLSDLIAIWGSLEQCMAGSHLADHIGVLELAVQSKRVGDSAPLVFYGLTELSELERRFIFTLLRDGRAATAYLPYREVRACEWVRPVYDAFRSWNFGDVMLEVNSSSSRSLARIQHGLFEEITPQEEPLLSDDIGLKVVSVPSREREVEEAVRNVLYSPLAETLPERKSAVLVREGEPYTDLLRSSFSAAGVKGYFHQCQTLGQTQTGRSLLLFASLLDEKFPRAQVMEFLLAAPVKWPVSLSDPLTAIPVAEWNQFSLLAGIVRGRESWPKRLTRLRNQFLAQWDGHGDDDDERAIHTDRLSSLEAMIRYVDFLFDSIERINQIATWRERTSSLWGLFAECVDSDVHGAVIVEALRTLNDLDELNTPLTVESIQLRIAGALSLSARRTDRFQVHEPTVAPMSLAVGLLFDEVLIPGMVEKEIPRPALADPLLLDDEREALNRYLGHKDLSVPLYSREREREMFLFHTAVTSAHKRIVLSYPRRDESSSRERLPSTYLLKVVEAATARTSDYAALESFISASPHGQRIPISRLRGCDAGRATSEFQYHEAMLGTALERKSAASLMYLIEDHPFFLRAVEADRMRHLEHAFTRYDGNLEDPALRARFRRWCSTHWPSLSPSLLEQYARCPFRLFVSRVLDVQPVDEPPEVQRITNLDRNLVLRGILELFYRTEQEAGHLPMTIEALNDLDRVALQYFADFERVNNAGVYLFWEIDKRRILNTLRDFVIQDIADSSGYVPSYFGSRFTLPLGGEDPLTFSGWLDRVDVREDRHARVISYKTGKNSGKDTAGMFHLPVYRLAAEVMYGLAVDSAADVYIATVPKAKTIEYTAENWQAQREAVLHDVQTVRRQIGDGKFYPTPSEDTCRYCPAREACGTGRMTAKWKYPQEGFVCTEEQP